MEKQCEQCGQFFWIKPSLVLLGRGRFCSRECQTAYRRRGVATQPCKQCGQEIRVVPWEQRARSNHFCSRKCYYESLNTGEAEIAVECQWCGDEFIVPLRFVKNGWYQYCSRQCAGEAQSLPDSSREYPKVFNEEFKTLIRERDNYECFICGVLGAKSVHHINYSKMDTWPENCITLCKSCHGKTNFNRREWQKWFTEQMQVTLENFSSQWVTCSQSRGVL